MAFLELHYYSKALDRAVTVNVVLPERVKTTFTVTALSSALE